MKISILASIGCQNVGDELILKNEVKLLKEEFGEKTKFIVFTYDKNSHFFEDDSVNYKQYFPIGSKNIKNIFRNMWNFIIFLKVILFSDIVVIGGGGIIYDIENQNTKSPLDLWIFRTKIIRFFRKKIYFFRIGIDIKNETNFKKIKKIFKKSYKTTVRDKNSKEVLEKVGLKSEVQIDPVFFDNGKIPEKTSCFRKRNALDFSVSDLKDLDFSGKTVGIAFRSGYLAEKTNIGKRLEEGKIREILNYLTKNDAQIILIPHSFHQTDKKANDYLFLEKFLDTGKNIEIIKSMRDAYEVYTQKKIDVCFSMRLHSMILAEVYEISYIGVSYSKKTDEALKIF